MIDSAIIAQVIACKNLGLRYPLANFEAAVATRSGRRLGVFNMGRVWSVLSAVLECVEVGACVVLLIIGLVFGPSSRYCGVARAIQTARLLNWR